MADYAQSNAFRLPFPDDSFDLVFCHFFLLWAKPLMDIMEEIKRILKPTAPFLAFAEPDYGGRIDFPVELAQLGQWQEQSLLHQGAHTRIGRELASHFIDTGFINVTTGVLGGEWKATSSINEETSTLKRDLSFISKIDPKEVECLFTIEENAHKDGTRTLFIPTFYALGYKS
jgi:SAM-dependent methyltransferase